MYDNIYITRLKIYSINDIYPNNTPSCSGIICLTKSIQKDAWWDGSDQSIYSSSVNYISYLWVDFIDLSLAIFMSNFIDWSIDVLLCDFIDEIIEYFFFFLNS